ncbi:hypothetical protein HDU98_007758 [Podochytrium sp. JEL0797]|nr:hypothetical protein HDU98_007758 [Podochytrium sp. JEL0797]
MATQYEFYNQSTIGMALSDALDEMIEEGTIEPAAANHMIHQFHASIAEALRSKVKAKATIKV